MLERSEIEDKYKWDLSELCKGYADFDLRFENLKKEVGKICAFEGKLNNEKDIYDYLCESQKFSLESEKLYNFIERLNDVDTKNKDAKVRSNKFSDFLTEYDTKTVFIGDELRQIPDETLLKYSKNPLFAQYDLYFLKLIEAKKHILSKEKEEVLADMSACMGETSEVFDMFDYSDVKFEDAITSDGKSLPLNYALDKKYSISKDRTLRKSSAENLAKPYLDINQTMGANYIANVKETCTLAKIRNYDSALNRALKHEEVDRSVYDLLISEVKRNLSTFAQYNKLKAKALGLEGDYHSYDVNVELENPFAQSSYTFDEAIDIVKKALTPLGKEYSLLIDKAVKEKWYDIMPNKNKYTGAYSSSTYRTHPLILLNFAGTMDDLSTIAHETGHAMHSYFSDHAQPPTKADYKIFVAEVASTVNEFLMFNYLIENSKNDQEKLYYYDYMLSLFNGTMVRQTMFAEFEEYAHNKYETEKSVTTDELNDFYYSLNKKYSPNVILSEDAKITWCRVPHFYNDFYVYKYATSITAAYVIAEKIASGDVKAKNDYLKFLCSGSSDKPVELLKVAGADLTQKSTYDYVFKGLNKILGSWKELDKKNNNITQK